LQVLPVVLPPLRERRQDVRPLAHSLLERIGSPLRISEPAAALLEGYDWPGNVRELLNVLRRAVLFADGDELDGPLIRKMLAASVFGHAAVAGEALDADAPSSLAEVERAHIERVLGQYQGNVTRAAVALGIDRRTLQRKLRAFGIVAADE
jgi:transcriptional regulator with PAS, ATPase and Fis domain